MTATQKVHVKKNVFKDNIEGIEIVANIFILNFID